MVVVARNSARGVHRTVPTTQRPKQRFTWARSSIRWPGRQTRNIPHPAMWHRHSRRQRRKRQQREQEVPLQRAGSPEDMAATVSFLVGPDSAYITGAILHVNGGLISLVWVFLGAIA